MLTSFQTDLVIPFVFVHLHIENLYRLGHKALVTYLTPVTPMLFPPAFYFAYTNQYQPGGANQLLTTICIPYFLSSCSLGLKPVC